MLHLILFEDFDDSKPLDNTPNKKSYSVIFVGGCDDRRNEKTGKITDKSLGEQESLLGLNFPVKSFRYKDYSGPKEALIKNPESIVIMFSSGCKQSGGLSDLIKFKDRMFIVEPYALGNETRKLVRKAVANGVPEKNVIVKKITQPKKNKKRPEDEYDGRGFGIVPNPTFTPEGVGHWQALTYIGGVVNQKFKSS